MTHFDPSPQAPPRTMRQLVGDALFGAVALAALMLIDTVIGRGRR